LTQLSKTKKFLNQEFQLHFNVLKNTLLALDIGILGGTRELLNGKKVNTLKIVEIDEQGNEEDDDLHEVKEEYKNIFRS
jgi:hypothetical protein